LSLTNYFEGNYLFFSLFYDSIFLQIIFTWNKS
uniref:NADH dehydrogenase subunit 5 n=1 Tax=Strongyloides venezuelensis TaxID=75913 RepID=A0A0K0FLX4_STRVS